MAKIFEHILRRDLAHVTRFNNRPQHFPESTAEHSFYVAYFTLILCQLLEKEGIEIDSKRALQVGLIHDVEESFSGDILNPFKHFNEKVSRAIAEVNNEMIEEVFVELPADLNKNLVDLWKEDNEGKTLEAEVVKVADKLSLLSKCYEETQAGNSYFFEIYKHALIELKNLDKPWWNKIKTEVLAGAEKEI